MLAVVAAQRERMLWEVVEVVARVSVVRILPPASVLPADESLTGEVSSKFLMGLNSDGGSKSSGSVSDSWTSKPSGTVLNRLGVSWRKCISLRNLVTWVSRDEIYRCRRWNSQRQLLLEHGLSDEAGEKIRTCHSK
jgi:hypothetical protein